MLARALQWFVLMFPLSMTGEGAWIVCPEVAASASFRLLLAVSVHMNFHSVFLGCAESAPFHPTLKLPVKQVQYLVRRTVQWIVLTAPCRVCAYDARGQPCDSGPSCTWDKGHCA